MQGAAVGAVDHRLRRARLVRHRPRHLHRLAASSTRWSTSCSPRWTASTRRNWSSSSAPPTSSSRSTRPCCGPGRFEFHLHIPYPDADDRRAILEIYDQKMGLEMTPRRSTTRCKRTGELVRGPTAARATRGDHLNALCRALARTRLREGTTGADRGRGRRAALTEYLERPEADAARGDASSPRTRPATRSCALFCEHAPPIERISIRGDLGRRARLRPATPTRRTATSSRAASCSTASACCSAAARPRRCCSTTSRSARRSDLERATDDRARAGRGVRHGRRRGSACGRWSAPTSDTPLSEHARQRRWRRPVHEILERERQRARDDPRRRTSRC